jgi:hypothetical protein
MPGLRNLVSASLRHLTKEVTWIETMMNFFYLIIPHSISRREEYET